MQRTCAGCALEIHDANVVTFGESLFHLNCFRCDNCHRRIQQHANLLFTTKGFPICENCNYTCITCGTFITDEPLMAGNDAYHLECFCCSSCHVPITDLIYTNTSKGVLCIHCHESGKKKNFTNRPLPSLPNAKENQVEVTQVQAQLRSSQKQKAAMAKSSTDSLSSSSSSVYTCSPSSPFSSESNLNMFGPVLASPFTTTSPQQKPPSSSSSSASLPKSIDLPPIPSLNLSFFDEESDELSNLTQSLGVGLASDDRSAIGKSKIKRASEHLQASLDKLPTLAPLASPSPVPTLTGLSAEDTIDQLKKQLADTNEKYKTCEDNFVKLKAASQKALEEFNKAKEEFAKEVDTKQKHEYTILQLCNQLTAYEKSNMIKDNTLSLEIDRLASIKVELVHTCNQLKQYRNTIVQKIESQVNQSQAGLDHGDALLLEHQKALQHHIKSLTSERDALLTETDQLAKSRDDIIQEMVVLNTKNAELSCMNNDLSRRMTEREREAAALLASTSFINQTPSPSQSTDRLASPRGRKSSEASLLMQRLTSWDSNSSRESTTTASSNKLFKKKANNMLNKISNYYGSPKKDSQSIYGHDNHSLYSLNVSSSFNMNGGEMKRKNSNQLSLDGSMSPGRHQFVQTSLLRPVKCAACGDKVWGATDYRCQCCGSVAHGRCIQRLPLLCHSAISNSDLLSPTNDGEKLFGINLTARIAYEDRSMPLLVEQCLEAVEARGMDYEGIYRKSGGAAQMRTIQLSFEQNEPVDLKDEDEINDICAVTSVLKQYFRELPNPLLTFELYDNWMDAVRLPMGEAKLDRFVELVSQLPKANYDTLKRLIGHLESVSNESKVNLMTVKNLAMVFGPTLLRDREATRDLIDMSYKNATIEYLINHTSSLFTN
ncbi:RhoGAP-domain-containing protein [Hesseltinella vesiculosa]|uniref:RhoGAP-domain-containing protein n=1 Tax=Hesseltinella vesiculosa TaxID=101127 RepID=A0A1X2GFB4_9FUNG|nr:RhoGAP-domain-containing protein [Hesseltinella vesiculosa]